MRFKQGIISFVAISLLLTKVEAKSPISSPKQQDQTIEEVLIEGNRSISHWWDRLAERIDLFIAGKKLTNKKNESSIRIENNFFQKEREDLNYSPGLNFNLRLPNTEEYWNLKFTSYDENKEKRASEKGNARRTSRERDLGASVGLFQKFGKTRTAFQPRVSFQNKLAVSHSLSLESTADFDGFKFNPKLEFFGNPNDGTGILVAGNFEIPINSVYSISIPNDGDYISRTHLFSVSNGISLGQSLGENKSLNYGLNFDSSNKGNYHLESYSFGITWYHQIYRNILDYSLTPFIEFTRPKKFNSTLGYNFSVNLNF